MKLENRRGLVTGASYGVGRAIAIALARRRCDLILTARSADLLRETRERVEREGGKGRAVVADLGIPAQVEQLGNAVAAEWQSLDFLVHVAFGHIGEDEGKTLLDVGVTELSEFACSSILGAWLVLREVAPLLQRAGGRAVFLVADWGIPQHNVFLSTTPEAPKKLGSEAFVSAKYAITGLVNAAERSLGVPTTGVYPGIIASIKPSSLGGDVPEYFDIDDPLEKVEAEEDYAGNWAIPLVDVAESVCFALERVCGVKAIFLKPATSAYDGLHV